MVSLERRRGQLQCCNQRLREEPWIRTVFELDVRVLVTPLEGEYDQLQHGHQRMFEEPLMRAGLELVG